MIEPVIIGKATLYNLDCMEYMATLPDEYFDLAIVDPPYGIGIDGQKKTENFLRNPKQNRKHHEVKGWDDYIPDQRYFIELFRVSKNQIIWGANYFVKHLTEGKKGWVFWYKGQEGLTMSDGEIAYSSFDKPTRIININRVELLKDGSIHPTQKPIKLYEWLLANYAETGHKILDTHGGSLSNVIACLNLGFEIVCTELDKDYFDSGVERVRKSQQQQRLFA